MMLALGILVGLGFALVGLFVARRLQSTRGQHDEQRLVVRPTATESSQHVEEIIVGPAKAPHLTMRAATKSDLERQREIIKLPEAAKKALLPLLEQAPRLVTMGAQLAGSATKLVLKFSPEVSRGLAGGSLKLAQSTQTVGAYRAIARGARGFVAHGELVLKLNPTAFALAAWQVAAVITAQKFLSDIDTRLTKIEKDLDSLRAFQEDQIASQLDANIGYMRDRANSLANAQLGPAEHQAFVGVLEHIDCDTRSVSMRMLNEMTKCHCELARLERKGILSVAQDVKNVDAVLAKIGRASETFLVAARIRLMNASLRAALELDSAYTESALKTLELEVHSHAVTWRDLNDVFSAKLLNFSRFYRSKTANQKTRDQMRQGFSDVSTPRINEADRCLNLITRLNDTCREYRSAKNKPIELGITVGPRGEVLEAEQLRS